jgi:cell wall-associated NlpC family hydrolase
LQDKSVRRNIHLGLLGFAFWAGCQDRIQDAILPAGDDTVSAAQYKTDTSSALRDSSSMVHPEGVNVESGLKIETGATKPAEVVAFAKSLVGVRYKYASTEPTIGFDCSGFITYVFRHFNIVVPRSSVDFTNVGTEVAYKEARPGDLILFTGTDKSIRVVGHMGLIIKNENNQLEFIHSSSGKANGVVITPLESYYQSRFVKVIRVFPAVSF